MVAAAKAVCQFSGVRVLCCQRGGSELSCGTEAAELVGMQARGAAVALPVPVPGAGGEGKVTRGSAQKGLRDRTSKCCSFQVRPCLGCAVCTLGCEVLCLWGLVRNKRRTAGGGLMVQQAGWEGPRGFWQRSLQPRPLGITENGGGQKRRGGGEARSMQ